MINRPLTAYLFLEHLAMDAEDANDTEFAEFVRDNLDDYWSKLSSRERNRLAHRKTSDIIKSTERFQSLLEKLGEEMP